MVNGLALGSCDWIVPHLKGYQNGCQKYANALLNWLYYVAMILYEYRRQTNAI